MLTTRFLSSLVLSRDGTGSRQSQCSCTRETEDDQFEAVRSDSCAGSISNQEGQIYTLGLCAKTGARARSHAPILIIHPPGACTSISPACTGMHCNCGWISLLSSGWVFTVEIWMRALSDNHTLTVVITPEHNRETVVHHWRGSSFLLQICNISTALGWRKSQNLASHGSLLQRLKYLVPATIELNPPHPQLLPQLHPLLNLPIQACTLTLTDGTEACECLDRRTNTNHFGEWSLVCRRIGSLHWFGNVVRAV